MGVKSTVSLSRIDAENRYADLIIQAGNPRYFIFKMVRDWDNCHLQDALEEINDHASGGEGFENYIIEDEA